MNGAKEHDLIHRLSALLSGAKVLRLDPVQELWSGYGAIYRAHLKDGPAPQVIVKHVAPPNRTAHPRGWDGDRSHQRKLRSYAIEQHWYQHYATRCDDGCRVPLLIARASETHQWTFVFEDLDAAGFPERRRYLSLHDVHAGLTWLAHFHATFLNVTPEGLWPVGTYWHLETRPDELQAIRDPRLREAAPLIDARLNQCSVQTLVHGDAKVANLCFPRQSGAVAAVDFQYVGGGCGMKDVSYFLGSCLTSQELEQHAPMLLDAYFNQLHTAVGSALSTDQKASLESEWRDLYPYAWADFFRFLAGWSPAHWKIEPYSQRLTDEVLASL